MEIDSIANAKYDVKLIKLVDKVMFDIAWATDYNRL